MYKVLKKIIMAALFFGVGTLAANFAGEFPPPGSNVAEQAVLQHKIEALIVGLDAKTWKQRKRVAKKLLQTLTKNPHALRFFFTATSASKQPEIRFQRRKVLKRYFLKNVYDPDRKMGFIGVSLAPGGVIEVKGVSYVTIRVVFTQDGFPGEKAGIKANDLILSVDGKKCSRKFSIPEFVEYISSKSPGETVKLSILSRGVLLEKSIVLGTRPEDTEVPSLKKSETELFDAWLKSISGDSEVRGRKPEVRRRQTEDGSR